MVKATTYYADRHETLARLTINQTRATGLPYRPAPFLRACRFLELQALFLERPYLLRVKGAGGIGIYFKGFFRVI